MTNNYNAIAVFYDVLSKLIFQKSIINAQQFLLQQIPANSSVLIVGGGTGRVLEELAKLHTGNITITYVEKSAKMIALSKKRNYKSIVVDFINQAIEDYTTGEKFDIVFTAFLFDNFSPAKIELVFSMLNNVLKPGRLWLYADFIKSERGKWWQKILLKTMYVFFKLTCNIETQQLTDMTNYFAKNYTKLKEAFFIKTLFNQNCIKKIKLLFQ